MGLVIGGGFCFVGFYIGIVFFSVFIEISLCLYIFVGGWVGVFLGIDGGYRVKGLFGLRGKCLWGWCVDSILF